MVGKSRSAIICNGCVPLKAKFEVIPGISSWMALCASAEVDMTEFGTSQAVLVVSLERMNNRLSEQDAGLGFAWRSLPKPARLGLIPVLRRAYVATPFPVAALSPGNGSDRRI